MATQSNGHNRLVNLRRVNEIPERPDDGMQELQILDYDSGIVGHFIEVNVRYGGGDKEHEFEAYWDGSWMKSDPPGIWIHLRHNANGDMGRALIEETLQISITEPADLNPKFFILIAGGGAQSEPFDVIVKR